jgi:hypothetical protein
MHEWLLREYVLQVYVAVKIELNCFMLFCYKRVPPIFVTSHAFCYFLNGYIGIN